MGTELQIRTDERLDWRPQSIVMQFIRIAAPVALFFAIARVERWGHIALLRAGVLDLANDRADGWNDVIPTLVTGLVAVVLRRMDRRPGERDRYALLPWVFMATRASAVWVDPGATMILVFLGAWGTRWMAAAAIAHRLGIILSRLRAR